MGKSPKEKTSKDNTPKEKAGKGNGIFKGPEFLRKFIVSLKRRPQNIPFLIYIIAFCVYSLNLTNISHTTARILGKNMGLYGFITMLFSILLIFLPSILAVVCEILVRLSEYTQNAMI